MVERFFDVKEAVGSIPTSSTMLDRIQNNVPAVDKLGEPTRDELLRRRLQKEVVVEKERLDAMGITNHSLLFSALSGMAASLDPLKDSDKK